jgi:hypothetical protein
MKLINPFKNLGKIVRNKLNINRKNVSEHRCIGSDYHYDDKKSEESIFNGMGPDTATEIIKRRIDKCIINEYGINELKNTGRYCIARVSEANGNLIHTLLVDKENGMTRSLCRKVAKKLN